MSAKSHSSGTNYLGTDSLAGAAAANQVIVMMGWFKRGSAQVGDCIMQLSTLGANPCVAIGYNATPNWVGGLNTVSGTDSGDAADNNWNHLALRCGPWQVTSVPLRLYLNGAEILSSTTSLPEVTNVFSRFRVFANKDTTGIANSGAAAECAVFAGLSDADVLAVISRAQTKAVTASALGIAPIYSWRLFGDGNATEGGVNLSATGTITYDTGDHPAVSTDPWAPAGTRRRVTIIM